MKMENLKFTSSFFNDDKYFLPTEKGFVFAMLDMGVEYSIFD